MKWSIGLILGLGLCLVFGASVSQGEWKMRIHQGATVEERALASVDSLTFYDDAMVLSPAGTFIMGSPTSEPGRYNDETQHEVTLTKAIYVSTYEVTQSEWQAVMGWNESFIQGAAKPVETLTWYDAVSYCNQRSTLDGYAPVYTIAGATYSGNHITSATVTWNQAANGYRLLTEAEWEYACRATSTTAFCNGAITNIACSPLDPNLDLVGWYCGNASSVTHDVGGKTANFWGLKDMHGNVWEWCWDWYGTYPAGPLTDPTGPASGSYRVIRGGGWYDSAQNCRSANRYSYNARRQQQHQSRSASLQDCPMILCPITLFPFVRL
jgi:formylglycine-generating enzyme required for sulfatase activity